MTLPGFGGTLEWGLLVGLGDIDPTITSPQALKLRVDLTTSPDQDRRHDSVDFIAGQGRNKLIVIAVLHSEGIERAQRRAHQALCLFKRGWHKSADLL